MNTITYGTFTNGKQAAQKFKEQRATNFANSLRNHLRRNTELFTYTVDEHSGKEMNELGRRKRV